MTKFKITINEIPYTDMDVVYPSDQLEINLLALSGADDALLTVTSYSPEKSRSVLREQEVLSSGDSIAIALQGSESARASARQKNLRIQKSEYSDFAMTCVICGQGYERVVSMVAGIHGCVCDVCIRQCYALVSDEV